MATTAEFTLRGVLKGHNGWVTCLATSSENPDTLISGSRGTLYFKKIIKQTNSNSNIDFTYCFDSKYSLYFR